MSSILLVALMQVSALGADPGDFDRAYHESLTSGRPLVVLVGAGWCSACQKMSNSILPQVAESGGLNKVVFTYVDFDRQRQLASRLSRGGSIPQLIRFDRTPAGWSNKRLIGARSPREVHDFINAGLRDEGQMSKVSTTDRPRDDSRTSARAQTLRSTPAASKPGTHSSVDATGGRQRKLSSPPVKTAGGLSHWMAFFRKPFPDSKDRHDSTVHEPERSSQVGEQTEAGQLPRSRETAPNGSESGRGGARIADSLSAAASSR